MKALLRHNVHQSGSHGKTMIMAHGYGCDQNMWRHFVQSFQSEFRTVVFDYVGAGGSDTSGFSAEKYGSLQAYADDLLEICVELNISDAIFVGHSVSAMIGILAVIKNPKCFSKLILVGPSPCYINDNDYVGGFTRSSIEDLLDTLKSNYLGWSKGMAPVIMGNLDRPELATELENSFCRTDPKIAECFARATFLSDNRKELSLVSTPSLILQCSEDVIAPLSVGEYLQKNLPKSTLKVLKAKGHCPHLSAPQETIEAIRNFLKD